MDELSWWINVGMDLEIDVSRFHVCPKEAPSYGQQVQYHLIACGLYGIMFAIELVEGKYASRELNNTILFSDKGKTAGLL